MKRLENVIKEIKSVRVGENRAWIFDEDGRIKENVICGEIFDLLEELEDYEIEVDDDFLGELLETEDYIKWDNTYNYNANISNDIDYKIIKDKENGGVYFVAMVHLCGDIRGNYTDHFVCHFDCEDDFYCLNEIKQLKMLDYDMGLVANICLLREGYDVYDCKNDEDLGFYYECEVEDFFKEFKKYIDKFSTM